jgi:tubulin polyglutamylase TTLL1
MFIVSRYIDNPFLVGRRKFDLRLYVLVTSWQPLQAHIHRSGFARFCAVQYTATPSSGSGKRAAAADLGNLYMHLTNVAIQKHGDEYSATHGGKWPLENLRAHLKCTVGEAATARAFADIRHLIIHSLLAVQPAMVSAPGCFELYGYDVMLDETLAPWLIEVNASPSLSATTGHDKRRKTTLVADVLDLVMPHTRPMVPAAPAAGGSGVGGSQHWRPAAMPQFELLVDEVADKATSAAAAIRSSAGR